MSSDCVRCGAADVHVVPQTAVEVSIAISWAHTASIDYHVCCACGHIELAVKDKTLLRKIAEKYPELR